MLNNILYIAEKLQFFSLQLSSLLIIRLKDDNIKISYIIVLNKTRVLLSFLNYLNFNSYTNFHKRRL